MEEEQTMNEVQDDDFSAHWTEPMDAPFASDMLAAAGPEDGSFFTGFEGFLGRSTLCTALHHQSPPAVPDLAALNDFNTRGPEKDRCVSGCFPTANASVPRTVLDAISPAGSGGQRNRQAQAQHQHHQYQLCYDKPDGNIDFLLPHQAANQWLLECIRMADELERYIHVRLSAADEVMRINRQSINKIDNVLEFEELTPSVSLLGLTCLAMSHVVTLYELAADALTSKGGDLPRGPLAPNANPFSSFENLDRRPAIRFGNFCLDSEEHQAIQEQIFLKELQRCSRAAVKLSSRLGFEHADGGRLQHIYSVWQSDIVARLEKVHSMVKKDS
ncbi:hypothetical protein GQ44DRAFT_761296 [Phaeosphaeriaceae sp. PMI808]|nr:hypothetical protein GQ44DRAFT_761296 [Phaeosphaeriaceae sp. PMI808]